MRKLLALLTLSVFLFSSCSLFKQDPQEAVNEGVKKLAEIKQSRSRTLIKGTIQAPTGEAPQKVQFNLTVDGYADSSSIESPIFDLAVKADVSIDEKKGSAELQFRGLEKKIFVKLNALSIPGEQNESVKAQLQQLSSQWWEIPLNETPFASISKQQKDIHEKFKTLSFFVNAQEEGPDAIEGVDATRYRVDVNKEAIKELILSIARMEGNVLSPEEEKAIGESLNDLEFSGALSVGDDDIAHRIKGTLSMQPDQGAMSVFDIDYSGWDFGEKQTVELPEGAKEFNPLVFLPLIGALSAAQGDAEVNNELPVPPDSVPVGEPTAPILPKK